MFKTYLFMAQKVFSSQTPAGCLAHPMGGLHPALEITDPKDGLKLKTEKQGKNQEKKKKSLLVGLNVLHSGG